MKPLWEQSYFLLQNLLHYCNTFPTNLFCVAQISKRTICQLSEGTMNGTAGRSFVLPIYLQFTTFHKQGMGDCSTTNARQMKDRCKVEGVWGAGVWTTTQNQFQYVTVMSLFGPCSSPSAMDTEAPDGFCASKQYYLPSFNQMSQFLRTISPLQ